MATPSAQLARATWIAQHSPGANPGPGWRCSSVASGADGGRSLDVQVQDFTGGCRARRTTFDPQQIALSPLQGHQAADAAASADRRQERFDHCWLVERAEPWIDQQLEAG